MCGPAFGSDTALGTGQRGLTHIAAFEACSSFTRVTACQIARPPDVDFVARFRPAPFPGLAARQLSNPAIDYSSGPFPHWESAPLGRTQDRRRYFCLRGCEIWPPAARRALPFSELFFGPLLPSHQNELFYGLIAVVQEA